jgi:hypothetical protein
MAVIAGPIQTAYQTPDYSPVIEANRLAGMQQQQIMQGAVGQVTDYFKQQGEKKKLIKQSDVQIDAALKLFPDLAPTLQGVRDQIRDENVPLNDRAAIAESVAGLINMGTNQMRFQAEQQMRRDQIEASYAPSVATTMPKPTTYRPTLIDVGGGKVNVMTGSDGYYYDPATRTPILDLDAYARGESPEVYGGGGMGSAQFISEADMIMPQGAGAEQGVGAAPGVFGVLPERIAGGEQASGIMNALGFSPERAGRLEPGIEGPVVPDLTSPYADPGQIQAVLDSIPAQAPVSPTAQPQAPPALKPRIIGSPQQNEIRSLTPQEQTDRRLPPGDYLGTFKDGELTRIEVIPPAEDPKAAVSAARGAELDKMSLRIVNDAEALNSKIGNIKSALGLLNSGAVKTGTFTQYKTEAKRLLGQDVASQEQFNSLVGNLAMEAIGLTKGAISDREMQYFTETLAPNQGKSVEGNKAILEFNLKAAERSKKIADEVIEMMDRGETAFNVRKKITEMQNQDSLIGSVTPQGASQAGPDLDLKAKADDVLKRLERK